LNLNDVTLMNDATAPLKPSPNSDVIAGDGATNDAFCDDEERFVEAVELRLRRALEPGKSPDSAEGLLSEASRHLTLADAAKRARPKLLWYFAQAIAGQNCDELSDEQFDKRTAALVDFAVVAELIHTASLMHDDVLDEATLRRGVPSVNARWDNCVAVLGGDAMLCTSLLMLEDHGMALMARALKVVAQMTHALVLEVQSRANIDVDEATWRAIADGKTGILFGWCGWAPAMLAENPAVAERFHRCGHHLGVAFQLADDLKDLTGLDAGKHRFTDIRTRTPAFPLVWAMAESARMRRTFSELWATEEIPEADVQAAGAQLIDSGALQATQAALRLEIDSALDALGEYAGRPGGREIAGFAMGLRGLL
jgi:octaprenyl-diphosphate synthase